MHGEEKDELVLGVLVSLDLLQHGLRLLQEDEGLLKGLLAYEVYRTLIQLVYHYGHLICKQK